MAIDYFSVDRRGFYKAGGTLGLFKQNPLAGYGFLSVEDFIGPQDLKAHLEELFPDGLSLHGWDYMTRHTDFLNSRGNTYSDYSVTLELVLEYVRRSSFVGSPSRLQSYFAFDSLPEVMAFKVGNQPVYRLDADKVMQADQCWLRLGNQNAVGSFAAHKFWSGAGATNPKWEHMLVPPVRVLEQVA